MKNIIVCLALTFSVSPAIGCLNDSELPDREREFRSRYLQQNSLMTATDSTPVSSGFSGKVVSGMFLAVAAIGMSWLGRRESV